MCTSSPRKLQAQRNGVLGPGGNHGPSNTPLNIQGLSRDQFSPFDMYKPVVQVFPTPYGRGTKDANVIDYLRSSPFLEHIDVTTTWKGMSLTNAELLFQIHQVFKASLESVLVEHLRSLHQQFLQESSRYHTEDFYSSALNRQMNFSRAHLLQTMTCMLRPRRNWDIYLKLLPLYLSTCDCLKQIEGDESHATAIEVRIYYTKDSWYLNPPRPVVEPARIPDRLALGQIQQFQREGQELIIIPYYFTHSFSEEKDNDVQISYSITSSQSWLSWDDSIGGFKGTLPIYSELQGRDDRRHKVYPASLDDPHAILNILRIDLKALVTKGRLPDLRIERTLRARLTFKIVPRYSHINTPISSEVFFRPFKAQSLTLATPTISWASGESPLNRSNSSDVLSFYPGKFLHPSKLHKKAAQTFETNTSSPMHVKPTQNLQKKQFRSGLEIILPKTRPRENTTKFSTTILRTPPDDSTIDRVLPFGGPISCLSKDRKQSLNLPPLIYLNRYSSLRDLDLSDGNGNDVSSSQSTNPLDSENQRFLGDLELSSGAGNKVSSSESTNSLESESQSLGGKNKIRKSIPVSELSINRDGRELVGSGNFCNETGTERDRTAYTTAYDAPVIKKRSTLSVLLNDVSHSIDAITQETPARLGEGQYYYGFSDSSSLNSGLSSRRSSGDVSDPKKRRLSRDSPCMESPRRCSSSIGSYSIDMVLEDSIVAPGLRREQALLWKALSAKAHCSPAGGSILNVQERKDIYEAMKRSAEEEQKRRDEKLGLADVFDDIFVADSSNVSSVVDDEMMESSSVKSELLSEDDSALMFVDQELEDSVNYGF